MSGRLASARRIVVKIGSSLLVDGSDGRIHRAWLNALADDIAQARDRGQEVLIVTSGAIAVGRRHLGLPSGPLKLFRFEQGLPAPVVGYDGLDRQVQTPPLP